MAGVNKVFLIGNLGKDPEVRRLENGTTVANFPLATTEYYKDKSGNRQEQTEWHNIVVWRALAEVAEKYLRKGSMVFIEGKIRTRKWEDKEKNTRYTTEIVCDNFTMLSRKSDNNQENVQSSSGPAEVNHGSSLSDGSDDLPF